MRCHPAHPSLREGDYFYGEVLPYPRIRKGAGCERVGCLIGNKQMHKWCVHKGGSRTGDFAQYFIHVQR